MRSKNAVSLWHRNSLADIPSKNVRVASNRRGPGEPRHPKRRETRRFFPLEVGNCRNRVRALSDIYRREQGTLYRAAAAEQGPAHAGVAVFFYRFSQTSGNIQPAPSYYDK